MKIQLLDPLKHTMGSLYGNGSGVSDHGMTLTVLGCGLAYSIDHITSAALILVRNSWNGHFIWHTLFPLRSPSLVQPQS